MYNSKFVFYFVHTSYIDVQWKYQNSENKFKFVVKSILTIFKIGFSLFWILVFQLKLNFENVSIYTFSTYLFLGFNGQCEKGSKWSKIRKSRFQVLVWKENLKLFSKLSSFHCALEIPIKHL